SPDDAAQGGVGVLEGEVQVPRGRHREVADLPLDQDVLQVRAERDDPADDGGELGDGQRLAEAHRWPPPTGWPSGSRRRDDVAFSDCTYNRLKDGANSRSGPAG